MGEMQSKTAHKVVLDQRKQMSISGVSDVCSFHENEVVLKTDGGVMMITGENLHVGKLLLEEGRVDLAGRVDGIQYEQPRTAGKLFRFGKRP